MADAPAAPALTADNTNGAPPPAFVFPALPAGSVPAVSPAPAAAVAPAGTIPAHAGSAVAAVTVAPAGVPFPAPAAGPAPVQAMNLHGLQRYTAVSDQSAEQRAKSMPAEIHISWLKSWRDVTNPGVPLRQFLTIALAGKIAATWAVQLLGKPGNECMSDDAVEVAFLERFAGEVRLNARSALEKLHNGAYAMLS